MTLLYFVRRAAISVVLLTTLFLSSCTTTTTLAYSVSSPNTKATSTNNNNNNDKSSMTRRSAVANFLTASSTSVAVAGAGVLWSSLSTAANASGGATAGKYTTIPIAKRRYYGRVQQAVHEFLELGPPVLKGDLTNPIISKFFDPNGIVVVEAKKKDVNGQCTKKGNDCRGYEVRDSRWNDMKASMYLLGNAFRINQTKAPDNLPTVQAARAFFRQVNAFEKQLSSKSKPGDSVVIQSYVTSLDILDKYLDLVELPPIDSGHYSQEFSTLVGEAARIT